MSMEVKPMVIGQFCSLCDSIDSEKKTNCKVSDVEGGGGGQGEADNLIERHAAGALLYVLKSDDFSGLLI